MAILLLMPAQMIARDLQAKKIIYETDMCLNVDDVGGLAVLHALANNGEAEILAVCFNEVHPYGAPAIDAINTWYGRGDIPIGVYKGHFSEPDQSKYLEYVAGFPHDLDDENAPNALQVYRDVLARQADSSVTIISVGFLNNLNVLLSAEPDLVARKVSELVIMAGLHNDGFNLVRHNLSAVSENVIENWPTPIILSYAGASIFTGDTLRYAPEENPVREAYYRFFCNDFRGRSSWDEMAVLYGVRGPGSYFDEISDGTGSFPTVYEWQMKPGHRSYLKTVLHEKSYAKIIQELMLKTPAR